MGSDQSALIQNADHVRQLMHLDDAPSAIGNAIVIAADRDQAVVAHPAFQLQERIEGRRGARPSPPGQAPAREFSVPTIRENSTPSDTSRWSSTPIRRRREP